MFLRQQRRLPFLFVAAFLLWLTFCLSYYYLVQNALIQPTLQAISSDTAVWLPLSFSLAAIGRTLLDLLAAVWMTLIALGSGAWLLRRFRLEQLAHLEKWLFSLGLGFAALGLLTLFYGLLGLLQPVLFYATAVALTLLSLRHSWALIRAVRWQRPSLLVTLYLITAVGLALSLALLPPTAWDSLFYHLAGPKLYLQAGIIRPGPDIPHLNFPSLFQMLFLMALALRGDVAAQLLHFCFSLMLAGLVYSTAREHLGVKNGWWAVVFLYGMPMTLGLAAWAYNDLALAFYSLAAVYAWLKSRRSEAEEAQSGWLMLSGACMGLALSLKYTAFVIPTAVFLLLVWQYRRRPQAVWRSLGFMAAPALVVALPWYVKNLLFTGNPVYPFLFGGPFWDAYRSQVYADAGTGIGLNLWVWLRLPFDLTLGLRDVSQDGPSGPFFLLFLPLLIGYAFVKGRARPPAAFHTLLVVALISYIFWTVGVINSASLFQTRLLLPGLVLLCPLLAWIVEDLWRLDLPRFSLQRLMYPVVALVMAAALFIQWVQWLPHQPWAYLSGSESRAENLQRRLGGHYAAMRAINEELPPGAVVLFLFEPRSYYCDATCRPDSILDRYGHWHSRYADAAAIAEAWRREGVTHVLLWQHGLEFLAASTVPGPNLRVPDTAVLNQLQSEYLQLIGQVGGYELYALPGH
jgi:4-amino-4-deoxy-L-arabinose transferase-like glycosyltransferase